MATNPPNYNNDPCSCTGAIGSAAYTQCHMALVTHNIAQLPACARGIIQQNQQALQQNPGGSIANVIGQSIVSAIVTPIEQALPGILERVGLFLFALVLIVVGIVILK